MSIFPYTFLGVTNEALNALNEVTLSNQTEFDAATGFSQYIQSAVVKAQDYIATSEDVEWTFLNSQSGAETLVAGTQEYTITSLARKVDWDSFFIIYDAALTKKESQELPEIALSVYRDVYRTSDRNTVDSDNYEKPNYVVRMQNGTEFLITPKPDEAYTVNYEYFGYSNDLTEFDDIPEIPVGYRDVLLWGVLWYAYIFREDDINASKAKKEFDDGINRMRRLLIPQATIMVPGE